MNNNVTKILTWFVIGLIFILSAFGIYKYLSGKSNTTPQTVGSDSAFPTSDNISTSYNPDSNGYNNGGGSQVPKTSGLVTTTSDNKTLSGTNSIVKTISDKPVSGSMFIERLDPATKQKNLFVRFMEREGGHLNEISWGDTAPHKISNTTTTRVYQTYFNNTGDNVLMRRLSDSDIIENILATLPTPKIQQISTSTPVGFEDIISKLTQTPLSSNIKEVAVSPSKSKIFYLTAVDNDYVGTTESFGGQKSGKQQVWSSPIGEWQVDWPKENTILFNTKPSASLPGYIYSLNLDTKDFSKIMGDVNGLTSKASPDLKKLIYSESTDTSMHTYVYDLTTRKQTLLPIKTLPEKCVWGGIERNLLYCAVPSSITDGIYPDDWYQGLVSFDDEVWQIDTNTGNTTILANKDLLDRSGGIDVDNIQLSPSEDYLILNNKKDLSLWMVKLPK